MIRSKSYSDCNHNGYCRTVTHVSISIQSMISRNNSILILTMCELLRKDKYTFTHTPAHSNNSICRNMSQQHSSNIHSQLLLSSKRTQMHFCLLVHNPFYSILHYIKCVKFLIIIFIILSTDKFSLSPFHFAYADLLCRRFLSFYSLSICASLSLAFVAFVASRSHTFIMIGFLSVTTSHVNLKYVAPTLFSLRRHCFISFEHNKIFAILCEWIYLLCNLVWIFPE